MRLSSYWLVCFPTPKLIIELLTWGMCHLHQTWTARRGSVCPMIKGGMLAALGACQRISPSQQHQEPHRASLWAHVASVTPSSSVSEFSFSSLLFRRTHAQHAPLSASRGHGIPGRHSHSQPTTATRRPSTAPNYIRLPLLLYICMYYVITLLRMKNVKCLKRDRTWHSPGTGKIVCSTKYADLTLRIGWESRSYIQLSASIWDLLH